MTNKIEPKYIFYLNCNKFIMDFIVVGNLELVGKIEIDGVTVYVIRQNDTVYITVELINLIPVGLVVQVPGYEPHIYFDELEGPNIFPHFGKNMYYYNINWIKIDTQFKIDFKIDTEIKSSAHRTLNQLIIEAHEYKLEQEHHETYLPLWIIEI